MCLKFGFVIFRRKDFGAKAAHKMLVKLTPGVLWPSSIILDTAEKGKNTPAYLLRALISNKNRFITLIFGQRQLSQKFCLVVRPIYIGEV